MREKSLPDGPSTLTGIIYPANTRIMSEELYLTAAGESEERARLLPPPSQNLAHLLGAIAPLAPAENSDEYGSCPVTEWVIEIHWNGGPHASQKLNTLFNGAGWTQDDRPTLYGMDSTTGKWTYLVSADGPKEVTGLKLGWAYIAPWRQNAPLADCAQFEHRLEVAQKAAASLPEATVRAEIDPSSAAKKVSHFVKLHEQFEGSFMLILRAPFLRKFEGRKLWDVLTSLGLKWGDMDLFHWPNPSDSGDDYFFSVSTSTKPGYFLPEEIAAGKVKVKDLLFHFAIPRSANPEAVLNALFIAAEYARSRLGGHLITPDGHFAEKSALVEALRQEVAELQSAGFVPGSGPALRLF